MVGPFLLSGVLTVLLLCALLRSSKLDRYVRVVATADYFLCAMFVISYSCRYECS